jgi:hypothetical protein
MSMAWLMVGSALILYLVDTSRTNAFKMCVANSFADLALSALPRDASKDVKGAKEVKDCPKILETPIWQRLQDGWPVTLFMLLLPVGLCWLIVYGPVRWIVRGFQNAAP